MQSLVHHGLIVLKTKISSSFHILWCSDAILVVATAYEYYIEIIHLCFFIQQSLVYLPHTTNDSLKINKINRNVHFILTLLICSGENKVSLLIPYILPVSNYQQFVMQALKLMFDWERSNI